MDLVNSNENFEHPLLGNNIEDKNSSLIIVVSSDRGLCGGLNSNIVKEVKKKINEYEGLKKLVTLVCIGKKGFDLLSGLYEKMFNFEVKYINISEIDYNSVETIGNKILNSFYKNDFQECSLFYNHFNSVISQEVKIEKLIPYTKTSETDIENQNNIDTYFEYEPSEEEVLSKILPRNFIVQMYKAILESRASEQGARMTAMDNATRNAGEMIDNLSLKYNRQRQAIITKELIEIISGAEAL